MRTLIIPRNLNKYDINFFYNFIKTYKESVYIINNDHLYKLLSNIEYSNLKIVLYTIYQILINDSLYPTSLFPTPSNGIELKNPDTQDLLGIYHAHLNDEYILIWYLTWNEEGQIIKFEYIKHPSDNYKKIINEIYNRNDDGFNIEFGEYFKDITNIVKYNINEKILHFKDFIKINK